MLTGTWIWTIIVQNQIYKASPTPVFDLGGPGFGKAYGILFFWQFAGQAFQQFLYWLVGQYATDLSSLSHHTGILRGVEALGQTVAWAMQTQGNANHYISIGLNFGITLISVPFTWIILSELEYAHEVQVPVDGLDGTQAQAVAGVVDTGRGEEEGSSGTSSDADNGKGDKEDV